MIGSSNNMMRTVVGLVSLLALANAEAHGGNVTSCPCLGDKTKANLPDPVDCDYTWAAEGKCVETVNLKSSFTMYPANYGENCAKHKEPGQEDCFDLTKTPPVEKTEGAADYCTQPWCYVDPCACDEVDITASGYFPQPLFFSYSTCGGKNTFSEFTNALAPVGQGGCKEEPADCKTACPDAFAAKKMCMSADTQTATSECLLTNMKVCGAHAKSNGGTLAVPLMCKMEEAGCAEKAEKMTTCTSAALKPHAAVMLKCLEFVQKKTLSNHTEKCCPFFKGMLDCRGQKCVDYSSVQAKAAWDLTGEGNTWSKALKSMPILKEQSAACDDISVMGTEEEVVAMIVSMSRKMNADINAAKAAKEEAATNKQKKAKAAEPAAGEDSAAPAEEAKGTPQPKATTKAPAAAVADIAALAQSAPILAMVAAITMSVQ